MEHEGLATDGDRIFATKHIIAELNRNDEAPWANWKNKLTAEKVAKTLNDYKVKSVQCRAGVKPPVGDRPAVRGYLLSDMEDLFERNKTDIHIFYPENRHEPVTPPADEPPEPIRGVTGSKNNPLPSQVKNATRDTAD